MSKRKRTGLLEDIFDLAALLPWWLDVVIAVLIFIGLHRYAAAPVPVSTDIAQAGNIASAQFIKALANIGQWLIPLAFLIGAGVSAWKRHQRNCSRKPLRQTARRPSMA
jgi:restriction system protein